MNYIKTNKLRMITLAASLLLSGVTSQALVITGGGTGGTSTSNLGAYTGSFDYTAFSDTSAQIQISLTNTSVASNGGYLTAIAFNNPSDYIQSSTLAMSGNTNFSILPSDGNVINTGDELGGDPYGDFDLGASITNSWIGGGSPTGGLGVGDSATFTFALTGTNLTSLTADTFFQTLSSGNAGEGHQAFAVRFRGFENGGSDKVIGSAGDPGVAPVPEPSTVVLFGMSIFMFGFMALRARNQKK